MVLVPRVSHAHLVTSGLGPFYDGVSHFILTSEDLLPALALALLADQRGSRAGRLALLLGLVHGYLNGSAMSQAKLGTLGLTGIVSSLFVVVALAAALVVSLRAPWAKIAVRVAGSRIVAIGLLLLGWWFRGP